VETLIDRARPYGLHLLRRFALPLALVAIAVVIEAANGKEALQYQRDAIAQGEWWRLITGHLAHLGWQHLLLNCAALLIIWELFFRDQRALVNYGQLLLLAAGVSAGLWWLSPGVYWYVGLSGVLHGLFVAGALNEWHRHKILSAGLLLAAAIKIGWEQSLGAITTSMLAGSPVVIDAHLYGAVSGALLGVVQLIWRSQQRPAG